jgi:hypothetical protein
MRQSDGDGRWVEKFGKHLVQNDIADFGGGQCAFLRSPQISARVIIFAQRQYIVCRKASWWSK